MSGEEKKLDGPDFAQGVPARGSRRGQHDLGASRRRKGGAWRKAVERCSRSGRNAPITTVRSPRACSSRIPSVARGTTPASACAPERRCARRRSTPSRAGGSSSGTGPSMCGKNSNRRSAGARTPAHAGPESIVIIGGGAAGNAAAEMLRREGYAGPVTMLSADDAPPYDRPNLSKDYLAGNAPEEWIPLRPPEFYPEHRIELRLGARVAAIDAKAPRGPAR